MRRDAMDGAGRIGADERAVGAHLGAMALVGAVQNRAGRKQPALDHPAERYAGLGAFGLGDFDRIVVRGFDGGDARTRKAGIFRIALDADEAAAEPAQDEAVEVTRSKRAEARIPFGWVVERGLLSPGTVLQGPTKRHRARVRADGTLVCADASGSIHRIAAHVQGLDACNGWTFWHYESNGAQISIDVLRQRLRAELA